MNTAKYRQLLADFNAYVGISDSKSARITSRWLQSLDELVSSRNVRLMLMEHTARVSRSLAAITILSKECAAQKNLPGAGDVLESSAADLLTELRRLQHEGQQISQVLADRGLEMIVGEFMSSVEFVMDYIQLHFNGSTLTTFTCPQIHMPDRALCVTDTGYRDALCSLIGAAVTNTQVHSDELLRICFTDDREITVSLGVADAVGPEYAYFTSPTGFCCSW